MTSRELLRRADQQAARIHARIAGSVHTLVLHYPLLADTPDADGTPTPAPAPVSPLTGVRIAPVLLTEAATEPEPRHEPVLLRCLWLDATAVGDLRRPAVASGPAAWVEGADAYAQVARPAVLDAGGVGLLRGTRFVAHQVEEAEVARYTLLKVTPLGASFGPPHSYGLWLTLHETEPT